MSTPTVAASFYWSRVPGKFVSKSTGSVFVASFSGTVREWYETLVEVVIDVARCLPQGRWTTFVVAHPDVVTMLECSVFYHPHLGDVDHGGLPATSERAGELCLNSPITVYRDPTAPRNRVLVGCEAGGKVMTELPFRGFVTVLDMAP